MKKVVFLHRASLGIKALLIVPLVFFLNSCVFSSPPLSLVPDATPQTATTTPEKIAEIPTSSDTIVIEPGEGAVFYVDANAGLDTNSGTRSEPWATIQYAASSIPEGSMVIVLEGHYPERVFVNRPDLVFRADGEVLMQGFSIQADHVAVSGFTIVTLTDAIPEGIGIDVPDAGYCLIENNRFLYNTWGGLRLDGSPEDPNASHDCIVRNNVFFRNGLYAAEVMGQNHLIENNDVSQTIQFHPCSTSTASWLDADAFRFHGSGHVFRNNYIHDMPFGDAGSDLAACDIESLSDLSKDFVGDSHTDCFQTYGGERIAGHDVLFEGNRCELPPAEEWVDGAGAKAFQGTGNTYDLTFKNNLVVADLLSFFADGCHDITIIHNTFIGSGASHSQGLQFENCSGNIQVKNNVFYNQGNGIGHIWQVDAPVDAGNNCVYLAGRSPSRPADPGDIWGVDPLLDAGFRLLAASPCIDAGADLGVTIDFAGTPRPQGDAVDIGAFEYPVP